MPKFDLSHHARLWRPVRVPDRDGWLRWGAELEPEVAAWAEENGIAIALTSDPTSKLFVVTARLPDDRSALLFRLRWL